MHVHCASPALLPPVAARRAGAVAMLLVFTAVVEAQGDCVPYEPTEAGAVIQGTWDAAFERDSYSFTVPSDPGGGYVIARIETDPPSSPSMRIIPPSKLGVVAQAAPGIPGPSPQSLEVAFEVAPDTTFDLEIFENAVSSAFPVAYTWSWTFVSRVDCFELNNALPSDWPAPIAVSKAVPLSQAQEAYSLAGHQTFAISGAEPQNFDWYNFTIDESTDIWLGTLNVPSDQAIRVRLFDADGLEIADGAPSPGETIVVGPTSLQPGTYYLDIHPEDRGLGNVTLSEGGTLPDHFETPYQFIVSTSGPDFRDAQRCWLRLENRNTDARRFVAVSDVGRVRDPDHRQYGGSPNRLT